MIPSTPFYFIRHGETDWNLQGIHMGKTDVPLNATGRAQAKHAAEFLQDETIAHIVTSPLLRAVETANLIGETLQKPVTTLHALQEMHMKGYEGQPFHRELFHRWLHGEEIEGTQGVADFGAHLVQAMSLALELPGPVLIVSHGGVYHVLRRLLESPSPGPVHNCAVFYHHPPEQPTHPWGISRIGDDFCL